jgi:hypothetical protein
MALEWNLMGEIDISSAPYNSDGPDYQSPAGVWSLITETTKAWWSYDGFETLVEGVWPRVTYNAGDVNGPSEVFTTSMSVREFVYVNSGDDYVLAGTGPASEDVRTAIYVEGMGHFRGVLDTGVGYIRTGLGGSTAVWSSGVLQPERLKYNGHTLAAFCWGSTTYLTTTDGVSWTSRTLPISPGSSSPRIWVIGSAFIYQRHATSASIYVSLDNGVSWLTRTLPSSLSNGTQLSGVAGDGTGKLLVVGASSPEGLEQYFYSEDWGATWSALDDPYPGVTADRVFPIWYAGSFRVMVTRTTGNTRVFNLTEPQPETVWSNVVGCNVS